MGKRNQAKPAAELAAQADVSVSEAASRDPYADVSRLSPRAATRVTSLEATLNCAAFHSTKDRHKGLFGQGCVSCHGTTQWTIADFQHPSPRSTDCAQCHQGPPSHYMMHFEMVSKKIAAAGQGSECCEGVQVNQCYRCHQTTLLELHQGLRLLQASLKADTHVNSLKLGF